MKQLYCQDGASIILDVIKPRFYEVCKVWTAPDHRRKGSATKLMKQVLMDADRARIRLRLVVVSDDDGGLNDEALTNWYRSFGFVQESSSYMMREPNALPCAVEA